jgi:outer membrane receptor protein involved in Fe transport
VDTGNALLEPERSRGIETGARFSLLEQQVAFTLYDRRKKDVRETSIIVDENGDILSIPINLGDRSSRGGQVSVRGKLSTEIGYSASAWMASAEFNRLDGGSIIRARAKEYGGNAQLEYTEGKQGEKGFGQATLNVRYQGPSQFLQSRTEGILAIDLAVTKYLTNKLSLVGALNRLIGNRKITTDRTATSFVERVTSNVNGPLIKLSLVYNLGK